MFQRYKIEKINLNNRETWFSAKESISLSKPILFGIWSLIIIILFFFRLFSVYILVGNLIIIFLPTIYLPFYKRIKPIWGLNNPTRYR